MDIKIGCIFVFIAALFAGGLAQPADGQVRPVYDYGAAGLGQVLKRLNSSASVMMIGAHPDDEDTALLAYLARGESARTAYLSLTRGDGGQNIIGPELGEALGVIRTEELLQARKLDGAEQYFTRAYDYGFSKTLEEARQKWDEEMILCDVVRAIRHFRPLVIVAQFSGTPADGHGQHQFAGFISPLAVKAANDAVQCKEAGPAWQVKKTYIRHGFRASGVPGMRINTGKYDPILGRSYFEIAMQARSQHKSQEQGVLELKGDMFSALNPAVQGADEKGIFDSLDVSVRGAAASVGENSQAFAAALTKIQEVSEKALAEVDITSPGKLLPLLAEGYGLAQAAEIDARGPAAKAFLNRKKAEFAEAARLAAGIQLDAVSDAETVVPGESFDVSARIYYPPGNHVTVNKVTLRTPERWGLAQKGNGESGGSAQNRRESPKYSSDFSVSVPEDAQPTQPYWLDQPKQGEMYVWPEGPERTLPFQEPLLTAEITTTIAGEEFVFEQPVEYRFADDVRGEIRRPVEVVPRVSLALDKDLIIAGRGAAGDASGGPGGAVRKEIMVSVTNNSSEPVTGEVRAIPPKGGAIEQNAGKFSLTRKGESITLPMTVVLPADAPAGDHSVVAIAKIGNRQYFRSGRVIAYPHIQTHRIYGAASVKLVALDLKAAAVRVGYIAGTGDRVPQAIAQMGLEVAEIDSRMLVSGDLSRFDVIVVGIRAYQVRPELVASNQRLLDFAARGGTLIVQYQLPAYTRQNLTPFPAQQGPRVSDETAAVTIIDPAHPVLNFPNKITQADFDGWVQERNLYNFSTMDPRYTGLLESHDLNEAANSGGLVVADVGKGKFVYCSYSLFRQLPAGVPGAYRLLANLLSIPKSEK